MRIHRKTVQKSYHVSSQQLRGQAQNQKGADLEQPSQVPNESNVNKTCQAWKPYQNRTKSYQIAIFNPGGFLNSILGKYQDDIHGLGEVQLPVPQMLLKSAPISVLHL